MMMMKKLFVSLFALIGAIAVTGCNTVAGAGKDIERGGEKIQSGSEKVQQKM